MKRFVLLLSVQLTVQSFPTAYIDKFMDFLADRLDHSPHLQFYLHWCRELLVQHGPLLKKSSMPLMAAIKNLQKSVAQRQSDLGQMYAVLREIPTVYRSIIT
jgi:periodic tryptophan protein 2